MMFLADFQLNTFLSFKMVIFLENPNAKKLRKHKDKICDFKNLI